MLSGKEGHKQYQAKGKTLLGKKGQKHKKEEDKWYHINRQNKDISIEPNSDIWT